MSMLLGPTIQIEERPAHPRVEPRLMANNRRPSWRSSGLLALMGAFLAGCTDFRDHRAALEACFAAGRYDQAATMLDDPKIPQLYGKSRDIAATGPSPGRTPTRVPMTHPARQ